MKLGALNDIPDTETVLKILDHKGHSVLASSISGANATEVARDQVVCSLQRRYFAKNNNAEATPMSGPVTITYSPTHRLAPDGTDEQYMVFIDFSVTQVPQDFTQPALARRKWSSLFKVTIKCACKLRLKLSYNVRVYAIDEQQVEHIHLWSPPPSSPTENSAIGLLNNEVSREMELGAAIADNTAMSHDDLFTEAQDVAFESLCFDKPSHMRPRWLVFELTFPGTRDRIYSHFKVPTIAMSRSSQLERCSKILNTSPLVQFSDTAAKEKLTNELIRSQGLHRTLTDKCCQVIAKNATLVAHTINEAGEVVVDENNPNSAHMATYFHLTKQLLNILRPYFDRTDAELICDFWVQREDAERILKQCPSGTFILRIGSEPGSLVASTALSNGTVEHMKISLDCLKKSSLEIIMGSNSKAVMLLDVKSNKLYPKSVVLQRSYVSPMVVKQAVEDGNVRPSKRVMQPPASLTKDTAAILGKRCAPVSCLFPPGGAAVARYAQTAEQLPVAPSVTAPTTSVDTTNTNPAAVDDPKSTAFNVSCNQALYNYQLAAATQHLAGSAAVPQHVFSQQQLYLQLQGNYSCAPFDPISGRSIQPFQQQLVALSTAPPNSSNAFAWPIAPGTSLPMTTFPNSQSLPMDTAQYVEIKSDMRSKSLDQLFEDPDPLCVPVMDSVPRPVIMVQPPTAAAIHQQEGQQQQLEQYSTGTCSLVRSSGNTVEDVESPREVIDDLDDVLPTKNINMLKYDFDLWDIHPECGTH